jgi:hypothetical protein
MGKVYIVLLLDLMLLNIFKFLKALRIFQDGMDDISNRSIVIKHSIKVIIVAIVEANFLSFTLIKF